MKNFTSAAEHALVTVAVRAGVLMIVVATLVAALVRGQQAALTAAAGVLVVTAVFASTGWSLAWAGRRGAATVMAVALGGFALRTMAYATAASVFSGSDLVDGPVLVVVVGAAEVLLLTLVARFALRHRELWWLTPAPTVAGEREEER